LQRLAGSYNILFRFASPLTTGHTSQQTPWTVAGSRAIKAIQTISKEIKAIQSTNHQSRLAEANRRSLPALPASVMALASGLNYTAPARFTRSPRLLSLIRLGKVRLHA
jgi:hypothetical protein